MLGLLELFSLCKNCKRLAFDQSERVRLKTAQIKHLATPGSEHDVWNIAHSEQSRIRTRNVVDAAINHWFVCNHGITHDSKPLLYDPNFSRSAALGRGQSLSNVEKMWESTPVKNQQGDELEDFTHFWRRDFGQGIWLRRAKIEDAAADKSKGIACSSNFEGCCCDDAQILSNDEAQKIYDGVARDQNEGDTPILYIATQDSRNREQDASMDRAADSDSHRDEHGNSLEASKQNENDEGLDKTEKGEQPISIRSDDLKHLSLEALYRLANEQENGKNIIWNAH